MKPANSAAGSACRVCIHILYIIVKWESNNKGFAITRGTLCARWNITQAIVELAPADPTFEMVSRPRRLPAPFDLGEQDLTTSVESRRARVCVCWERKGGSRR